MTREIGIGAAIETEYTNLELKNVSLTFEPPASSNK
jgi:hypothetical protein